MRKHIFIVPFLFLLSIFSCKREADDYTREGIPTATEQGEIIFNLSSSNATVTKSQYQESDLKAIHNVWVLAVADDGFWRAKYYTESDLTANGASVTCPSMNFKVGSSVTFYVTANMGDLTDAATPGEVATPSGIEYMIPASVDFSASGMPMAAEPLTKTVTANTSVSILLEPLLARLNITIDKNGITDNTVADVLASGAIKVKHANRRLCPFGVSSAYSPEHMFSVVVDTENFSSSVSYDMTHPNVVLYVPENSMGNLLGPGSYTQWDKGNQGAPGKQYATYIEYTGHKNAADDGIGGDLSYRAYLGENETSNYSINRNTTYNCTLGLTWNGLFFEGDWRIDNSDLTDGRRLTISGTPHTTSTSFTDMGRLRRNVAAPVYVNFSRDGGTTWVHSAKDIDGWPYGWDLYIDGVKQASGASATADGDLGWAYSTTAFGDRLAITPGPSSVTSSTHTLQVKSADGRVASNVVAFQVSSPLTLTWDTAAPTYVAQRGRLYPTDLEDPSAEVVYTITSGASKVRLNAASDVQSIMVGLLAPGTATVHAECVATGQSGDLQVTVASPSLRGMPTWPTRLYANPDGTPAHTGTNGLDELTPEAAYYTIQSGMTPSMRMSRRDLATTELALNANLASDLYDELLALTPTVTGTFLGASSDGLTVTVYVDKLTSGSDTYPTSHVANLGTLTVTAKSIAAGVESLNTSISSVMPFGSSYDYYRSTTVSVETSKDIHDFSVLDLSDATSAISTYGIPNTTYNVTIPTITCTPSQRGAEVTSGPVFQGTVNATGTTFSWSSALTAGRSSNDTAGIFEVKGYVWNIHSNEKLYSPTFYRGRLFRHGCVVAYGFQQGATTQMTMGVSCRYLGPRSAYTSSGLGCAFPNVKSHRSDRDYRLSWRKTSAYSWNIGNSRVEVRAADIVTGVKSDNTGMGQLFTVQDLCGLGYDGQWVDDLGGYTCHGSSVSVIHQDSFDGAGGSPEMYFTPRDGLDDKYLKIKVANESLVFLKPTTTSATHDYSSTVTGCGFFVLHLVNKIKGNWF